VLLHHLLLLLYQVMLELDGPTLLWDLVAMVTNLFVFSSLTHRK
jgi:hypothetical protein